MTENKDKYTFDKYTSKLADLAKINPTAVANAITIVNPIQKPRSFSTESLKSISEETITDLNTENEDQIPIMGEEETDKELFNCLEKFAKTQEDKTLLKSDIADALPVVDKINAILALLQRRIDGNDQVAEMKPLLVELNSFTTGVYKRLKTRLTSKSMIFMKKV